MRLCFILSQVCHVLGYERLKEENNLMGKLRALAY